MHRLVAQCVQAHEHFVQQPLGILLRQRTLHALARIIEGLAPVLRNAAIAVRVVERVPRRLEYVLVTQQHANRAREHLPQQRRQSLVGIQTTHLSDEITERLPLRGAVGAACVLRVGRIEGNPLADKSQIVITTRRLGTLQSAQSAVHAQGESVALQGNECLVALHQRGQTAGGIGRLGWCGHRHTLRCFGLRRLPVCVGVLPP